MGRANPPATLLGDDNFFGVFFVGVDLGRRFGIVFWQPFGPSIFPTFESCMFYGMFLKGKGHLECDKVHPDLFFGNLPFSAYVPIVWRLGVRVLRIGVLSVGCVGKSLARRRTSARQAPRLTTGMTAGGLDHLRHRQLPSKPPKLIGAGDQPPLDFYARLPNWSS